LAEEEDKQRLAQKQELTKEKESEERGQFEEEETEEEESEESDKDESTRYENPAEVSFSYTPRRNNRFPPSSSSKKKNTRRVSFSPEPTRGRSFNNPPFSPEPKSPAFNSSPRDKTEDGNADPTNYLGNLKRGVVILVGCLICLMFCNQCFKHDFFSAGERACGGDGIPAGWAHLSTACRRRHQLLRYKYKSNGGVSRH